MLTIKDLSTSKDMDTAAMTAIRGGIREIAPVGSFGLGDFQNSFNLYHLTTGMYYAPDYSVDVLEQSNVGAVSASGNFGSVVIPQLAQSNGGANG